ncbi:MAG: heme-binding domain-containing protein [Chitinophagaceae bacterium]|nr:heme-binding domain-containing protein [Chitinophagaceae bacterium]
MKRNFNYKKASLIILVLFLAFQFYQPSRNMDNNPVVNTDFIQVYNPPAKVKQILLTSCYSCHSNNTHYQWFDYIQPGRALVEYHIRQAKKDLNFNEWGNYFDLKQDRLLGSIKTQVEKKEMPLRSYTWFHTEARLTDAQRKILINWITKQQ